MLVQKKSRKKLVAFVVIMLMVFVQSAYAIADDVGFGCVILESNEVKDNSTSVDDQANRVSKSISLCSGSLLIECDQEVDNDEDVVNNEEDHDVFFGCDSFKQSYKCEVKGDDHQSMYPMFTMHSYLSIPIASTVICQICFPDGIVNMPGVGNPNSVFVDNSVAKWVGGSFTATQGFAESEGLNVILGNLYLRTGGLVNFGVVGVGSGIIPSNGSVMLAVGGDVVATHPSNGKIGAPIPAGIFAGRGFIGGSVTGNFRDVHERQHYNSNSLIYTGLGAGAVSHWNNFGGRLRADSSHFRALQPTGAVSLGANITFNSTNPTANPQVFNVHANVLNNMASGGTIGFTNIPVQENGLYTPTIINVYGGPVNFSFARFAMNGTFADYPIGDSRFGNVSSALLWNFADTTSLRIDGTSQFMGSIIAPNTQTTYLSVHTNGRLFVNGNLTRAGWGTEHHNFPWLGGTGDFTCTHGDGVREPGDTGKYETCDYCGYYYDDCDCYSDYCDYCEELKEDCTCYDEYIYVPCENCDCDPLECGCVYCLYCEYYDCECEKYYYCYYGQLYDKCDECGLENCDCDECDCDESTCTICSYTNGTKTCCDDDYEEKKYVRTHAPKTGDNIQISTWITLLIGSLILIALIVTMKQKKIQ